MERGLSEEMADGEERTDTNFLQAFEAATLSRPEWTHAAHLRMAYLYLRGGETWESLYPIVRERIICFNLAHGNRTGYHDTLTASFLRIVADRLKHSPAESFAAFRQQNDDLFADGLGVMRRHYSDDLLFSREARVGFVPPDREPLPD